MKRTGSRREGKVCVGAQFGGDTGQKHGLSPASWCATIKVCWQESASMFPRRTLKRCGELALSNDELLP